MDDPRLDTARTKGDHPRAPAWVGWWVIIFGCLGTLLGAWLTPWRALVQDAWSLQGEPMDLLVRGLLPTACGGVMGTALGVIGGHLILDPFVPQMRTKPHRGQPPKHTGLAPFFISLIALAGLPWVLTLLGDGPGQLMRGAPLLTLGLLTLVGLPLAVWARARGITVWQERVAPWPPPVRDPDDLPPEVRAALNARFEQEPCNTDDPG